MKKLSLIMALVLIISTLSIAPLMASAAETNTLIIDMDMTGVMSTTVNKTSQGISVSGFSPNTTANYLNKTNPQKETTDVTFHHSQESVTSQNIYWGGQRLIPHSPVAPLVNAITDNNKYATYEFDLLFGTIDSAISLTLSHNSNQSKYYSATIKAGSSAPDMDNNPDELSYDAAGINKWHRVRVLFPINGVAAKMKMYVDNVLVSESANEVTGTGIWYSSTKNAFHFYSQIGTVYDVYMDNLNIYVGDGNFDLAPIPSIASAEGDTVSVPFGSTPASLSATITPVDGTVLGVFDARTGAKKADDADIIKNDLIVLTNDSGMYKYYTASVEAQQGVPPTLTSVGSLGIISGKSIILNESVSAGTLANALVYNNCESAKIYASDKTTEKTGDTDLAKGDVLVLKNGDITAEYKITYYDTALVNLKGNTHWMTSANSLSFAQGADMGDGKVPAGITSASMLCNKTQPQKADTDKVFHITYTGKSTANWTGNHINYSAPRTYPANFGTLVGANDAGYNYAIYEFDVLFGNDTSSITIGNKHNGGSNIYSATVMASDKANGIFCDSGKLINMAASIKSSNAGVNKWHRVRTVFPINGQTDEPLKLYVDDMTTPVAESAPVNDGSFKGMDNAPTKNAIFFLTYNTTTDVYFDNLKFYAGDVNIPATVMPSLTALGDNEIENNTVAMAEATNVAGVKAAATVADGSVVGVFDKNLTAAKVNAAKISSGDVLVLNNEDGRYSYYTLSIPSLDISNSAVTLDGTTVTVNYNYANTLEEAKNVKFILAIYSGEGTTLALNKAKIETVTVPVGTTAGSKDITVDAADLEGATSIKVFIIDDLELLTPYCEPAVSAIQ